MTTEIRLLNGVERLVDVVELSNRTKEDIEQEIFKLQELLKLFS